MEGPIERIAEALENIAHSMEKERHSSIHDARVAALRRISKAMDFINEKISGQVHPEVYETLLEVKRILSTPG